MQNDAGVSFVSTTVFALIPILLFKLGYLLQLGVYPIVAAVVVAAAAAAAAFNW